MDQNKRINTALDAVMTEARRRRAQALDMHTKQGKSLKEIGEFFGVTRERARQLVAKGMKEAGHG